MSSPQAQLRPAAPAAHRLGDLVVALEPRITVATSTGPGGASGVRDWAAVEVTGAAMGSADVAAGDVFIAVPGERAHGARFAGQAVASGARAVLTDPTGAELVAREGGSDVPVLVVAEPRVIAGDVAAWVYDHPATDCVTVGVTGTNGKTTTTYLVDSALRAAYGQTVMLGTVEMRIGPRSARSVRTTVEAPVLQGILARAREDGVTALSMEVSSHALSLSRVNGVVFDVAGFTNLQRDHLDFHGDMEGYFRAKSVLFTPSHARRGVVVVDDEWGRRLAAEATIDVDTLSTRPGPDQNADWAVVSVTTAPDGVGSAFVLRGPDGSAHQAVSPIPGGINVSNAALAIVLAHRAGVDLAESIAAIAASPGVPGRMERVLERGSGSPLALVDYAHTPDALALALEAVRPVTPGRLIVVFGAGGDRDHGKRELMGRAAAGSADVVIVTDDNPRSEDAARIRAQVMAGAQDTTGPKVETHEVAGRDLAIELALGIAQEEDTIVVAGKGHETTQEIGGTTHPFSDQETLRSRAARSTTGSHA